MDIKEYIASGIIESYVLGQATDQERREVECMSSIYPEIKQELFRFQEVVEKVASEKVVEPPESLKNKVLSAVYREIERDKNSDGNIVKGDFATASKKDNIKIWKYVAAASLLLFFTVTTILWNNYITQQESEQLLLSQINELESNINQSRGTLEDLKQNYQSNREKLDDLTNKNTVQVNLAGTDLSSNANVSIFWNKENERVYLKVNDLPATPTKKQYQLWAIVDGNPTDMGVLPLELSTDELLQMPNSVSNPVAFAITLEEEGGRPEPNLEALYVIGEVKS